MKYHVDFESSIIVEDKNKTEAEKIFWKKMKKMFQKEWVKDFSEIKNILTDDEIF